MANILAVGIATLDIINITNGYPQEDAEVRALDQHIRRGGNSTNTLVVLSQLGHQCHWLGNLADDLSSKIISEDLHEFSIDFSKSTIVKSSVTPTSYITLNQQNGSRTIVHYRDLPELSADQFSYLSHENFDWIHFEARNISETKQMLLEAQAHDDNTVLSVEIEKQREHLEELFNLADVYFFSKAFAASNNFSTAEQLLRHYRRLIPESLLVCAWGKEGAYALEGENLFFNPAKTVSDIVDTVGAGDTFNAGFIHASISNKPLDARLTYACDLATKKCEIHGFKGLV